MAREELYLQDIIKSVDDIKRFLDGVNEAKFLADEILQNAILMKLIVIGEAAARVSEKLEKNILKSNGDQSSVFVISPFTLIFPSNGISFGKL